MKAFILNSGLGYRMGEYTREYPKCMTYIDEKESILSRQLKMLADLNIRDIIITTGPFENKLKEYCISLGLPMKYTFVHNEKYMDTNYIYSIYKAREQIQDDDLLFMHGDLVFEFRVLEGILGRTDSCMAVSSKEKLSEKDFKAIVADQTIQKISVELFEDAIAAQPLYKLNREDWKIWLDQICNYCEAGKVTCYAEKALNEVLDQINLRPYDIKDDLCNEIDDKNDLIRVSAKVHEMKERIVYMAFATDVIHSGHIAILKKASHMGRLVVGVLSDYAVASYKRFPLIPFRERKELLENIQGVYKVIEQKQLSYKENLCKLRPAYVIHGDDWKKGNLKPIRDEVIHILQEYGGQLIEFPYSENEIYKSIEKRMQAELSIPDFRRGRLKKAIELKGYVNAIEAHSGITGLIAENTIVEQEGKIYQFDAIWVSSLCDSTTKGKPDIELVDMTSRFRTIDDIMEVTTKPIIFDGDTGGLIEHFVYTVKSLERVGVSMIIIEDKTGLKKNSLFGTEVKQTQDSMEQFCEKLSAGRRAKKTDDFMIVARIESLILEKGINDALKRAEAYVAAGADGIMIHSRKKEPDEVFQFADEFRKTDKKTPLVVVPTTFHTVREEEFYHHGFNVIIYANQLTRSGIPAMQKTAKTILENHRAKEADELCMPIQEIITLIPEEN
ncbi:phosphoenolpyruvate mutase [Clostridiaceae bacterium]|nr:phosphoenolpyruvate mutase [Clostridiaceae bacterium]